MPKRGYGEDEDGLIRRLFKAHGGDLEKIGQLYHKEFPEPVRTPQALRTRWNVIRKCAAAGRSKRRAANGKLVRIVAWFQGTAKRADDYRYERDGLAAEVRKLRLENRVLKRANDQLAGQLAKVKKIAAVVEAIGRSPRVEAAKVKHAED